MSESEILYLVLTAESFSAITVESAPGREIPLDRRGDWPDYYAPLYRDPARALADYPGKRLIAVKISRVESTPEIPA